MKHLLSLFAVVLSLSACSSASNNTNSEIADTGSAITSINQPLNQMCFQRLEGTANQDTTSLKLIIEGNSVSGNFGYYPMEKDRRVGTISATKDGDIITGQWIYMQEGATDSLQVEFKLNGDKLIQKNYTIDPQTGREILSEASVFNLEFDKIVCKA